MVNLGVLPEPFDGVDIRGAAWRETDRLDMAPEEQFDPAPPVVVVNQEQALAFPCRNSTPHGFEE